MGASIDLIPVEAIESSTVPIEVHALPEFHSLKAAKNAVDLVRESQIPGIIIRSPGGDPSAINDAQRAELAQLLTELYPETTSVLHEAHEQNGLDGMNALGIGPFHTDSSQIDTLTAHTTESGAGKVLLALAEPGWDAIGQPPALERRMDKFLLMGVVDPEYVNPEIFTASLRPGDTVIMRADCWHRFDSDPSAPQRSFKAGEVSIRQPEPPPVDDLL